MLDDSPGIYDERHRRAIRALPQGDPIRSLEQDWIRLCGMGSILRRQIAQWSRSEPDLDGLDDPRQILHRIHAATGGAEDALLLALIRLAQSGRELAGTVVLHAMLGKLIAIARSTTINEPGNHSRADRHAILISTFWEVLQAYPLHRERRVAANLALDTLHRYARIGETFTEVPLSECTPAGDEDGSTTRSIDPMYIEDDYEAGPSADAELVELLAWGVDVAAITAAEASLLVKVYLPDPGESRTAKGYGTAFAATEFGISVHAVKQRCRRARQRLIDAVRADGRGEPISPAPDTCSTSAR